MDDGGISKWESDDMDRAVNRDKIKTLETRIAKLEKFIRTGVSSDGCCPLCGCKYSSRKLKVGAVSECCKCKTKYYINK